MSLALCCTELVKMVRGRDYHNSVHLLPRYGHAEEHTRPYYGGRSWDEVK